MLECWSVGAAALKDREGLAGCWLLVAPGSWLLIQAIAIFSRAKASFTATERSLRS